MRVAIVNDLALAREVLRRSLALAPEHEIAWIAEDGRQAAARCAQDTPDVILMDLVMPIMDGVKSTRQIMATTPCAILVVTATVEGHAPMVFEAMGAGALDAVATPVFGDDNQIEGAEELLRKLAVIGLLLGKPVSRPAAARVQRQSADSRSCDVPLVVIGASTGGPGALATILSGLPGTFPGSIVVVQHIDRAFTAGLAQWLDAQTPLEVKVAGRGDILAAGRAFVAIGPDNLVLSAAGALEYVSVTDGSPYHPCIDIFFESVAARWQPPGVAVILSGMGRDGVEGMLSLQRAGWMTIAQDDASCAVYGMPKAAVERRAARQSLPPDQIAAAICSRVSTDSRRAVRRDSTIAEDC